MTLADAWAQHWQGMPPNSTPAEVFRERRLFMAGAMETLSLLNKGATREQLMAECLGFGRTIGTAVERAA